MSHDVCEAPRAASALPNLSVVLPVYRAAELARRSVSELGEYLTGTSLSWEIVVVDDGGGGIEPWREREVSLIQLPENRGKGAAVRAGMLAARGEARVFTDIDLPYDLRLLPVIASYIERGFHVVVGDRTLPLSSYHADVPWSRQIASRTFSLLVGTLVTGGFHDTQCGIKGLRGDVADALFRIGRLQRFAFDVELIYMALKHGLDVKRIPVSLRNDEGSSVRLMRDSLQMITDVLRIKYHQMSGHYRSPVLEEIVSRDFALVRSGATAAALEHR